jgi:hypothetical protein
MLFATVIIVICVYVVVLTGHAAKAVERVRNHKQHLNVLLVGDSVDRFLVTDYCRAQNANLCATIEEFGGKYHTTNCTSEGSYPVPLSSLFQFSKRIFPWSVVICDDTDHNVSIGFLFNTQGVSPQPPWFWPAKSTVGLEDNIYDTFGVGETFDVAQGPAVAQLLRGLGGEVDAFIINSVFWDIGRLVTGKLGRQGGTNICSNPAERAEFVSSWARNASHLIHTISRHFPHAAWKGWRTANHITNAVPPCRNNLVVEMNRASYHVAKRMHLSWLDFFSFPGVGHEMRDSHHPNANVSAAFMRKVIDRIRHELW